MLNIDSNGRLDALRIALQDATRFTLIFIEVPVGPAREELLQRLRAWSGSEDVPPLRFVALGPSESPWNALQALALPPDERVGVVLTGLEQFNVGGSLSPTVHVLNLARDLLSRTVPGPLVLLADAATLRAISEQMPDLYSWRSFETQVEQVGIPAITPPLDFTVPGPPQVEAREELERLRGLLANLPEGAREVTSLKLRLAKAAFDAHATVEAAALLSTLAEPSADAEPLLAARWAELSGDIALQRSDHDTARLRFEQALTLYRNAGDRRGEADCIVRLGDVALHRSDLDTARACYEEALALFRSVEANLGEANCIHGLGIIALRRADHTTARLRCEQALLLYRRIGDTLGEANCILTLGQIASERSDHDAAGQSFSRALSLYLQIGDVQGAANSRALQGIIDLECSDHDTAQKNFEQALTLYRKFGDLLGEANCIRSLGDLAFARSDHDTARGRFEQALSLYRKVGDLLGEANCMICLANVALQRSDPEIARLCLEQALMLFRKVGQEFGEANCIRSLGDIALASADHDTARGRYEQALTLYQRISDRFSIGFTHLKLAAIATSNHERDQHTRLAREAWLSIGRQDLLDEYLTDAADPPPTPTE